MELVSENKTKGPEGPRYYVTGAVMNVEEDRTHEFKGHRNIAIEEIPPWCIDATDKHRKTRNCISRNICGFLNSGLGGIIYLGVLDDGNIAGIFLSRYQRDHLKMSLKDTLQRFRPPVPSHLVSIKFVPCIDLSDVNYRQVVKRRSSGKSDNTSDDLMREHCYAQNMVGASEAGNSLSDDAKNTFPNDCDTNTGGWDWALENVDITELPREIKYKNDTLRKRPHLLRTYKQCWCDDDAVIRVTHGHRSPAYVVEIVVRPPNPRDPEIRKHLPPSSELLLQPIFQAEDGSIYIRRHASLARRSLQDMVDEAVEDVHRVYFPILKEVQIHLGILEALVEKVELLKVNGNYLDDTSKDEKSDVGILQRIRHILK